MKRILLMVFKNILLVPVMWCKLCYYAGHVEKIYRAANFTKCSPSSYFVPIKAEE